MVVKKLLTSKFQILDKARRFREEFQFGSFKIRSSAENKAWVKRQKIKKTRIPGSQDNSSVTSAYLIVHSKFSLAGSASGCGFVLRKLPKSTCVMESGDTDKQWLTPGRLQPWL